MQNSPRAFQSAPFPWQPPSVGGVFER